MIPLTRLNGSRLYLNIELVKWIEATPDTVVTLVTGEKIVVAEPIEEVVRSIHARRSSTVTRPALEAVSAVAAATRQDEP